MRGNYYDIMYGELLHIGAGRPEIQYCLISKNCFPFFPLLPARIIVQNFTELITLMLTKNILKPDIK
jgi:hypothetical protein